MATKKLVPIKVKIRYGKHSKTGKTQHIYPDFNSLPSSLRADMDWSEFFDAKGIGWHYDHFSGIGEIDSENPDPDIWIGCTCLPKAFVDAAVVAFPNDVETMTKNQFKTFYDNRAHAHEPKFYNDDGELQTLKVRVDLGILSKTDKEYLDAVDPTKPTPGIRNNDRRTWAKFKLKAGVDFDTSVRD